MYASTSPGPGAQAVAKAFYEGYKLKRGNCETDGATYWLFGHAIARRIPDHLLPDAVERTLAGGTWPCRLLEYSWAGWPTNTATAHLKALGVRAHRSGGPCFNGVPVDPCRWYSPEEIAVLKPPVKAKAKATKFVNLTADLFA